MLNNTLGKLACGVGVPVVVLSGLSIRPVLATSADQSVIPPKGEPAVYAKIAGQWPFKTESPEQAIDETMAGLDAKLFASIALGSAPSDSPGAGPWLYSTLKVSPEQFRGDNGSLTPALWEADLAEGAIADRIAGDQSDLSAVVVGTSIDLEDPDGQVEHLGGGVGDVAAHQVFAAQSAQLPDSDITAVASKTLAAYGLDPIDVHILHPLGPALSITCKIQDSSQLKDRFPSLFDSLTAGGQEFEGIYLEIDTPNGEPLLRTSGASRAGVGRTWFAPGIDTLWDVPHL